MRIALSALPLAAVVFAASCVGATPTDGVPLDGGPAPVDSGDSSLCVSDAECEASYGRFLEPAGCADLLCVPSADTGKKRCLAVAKDQDGDGHRTATCAALGGTGLSVSAGDDCDDRDNALYAGVAVSCSAAGVPPGPPQGICRAGTVRCSADGRSRGACEGAVGPTSASESTCDGLDNDCDGTVDEGCACTPGATQPCGGPAVGLCMPGTQTCTGSSWGTCQNEVKPGPRRCKVSDSVDADCNGTLDFKEAACQCGGKAVGATESCGVGACAGTRTCVESNGTASWGACSGPAAGAETCHPDFDLDCNGVNGDGQGCHGPAGAPTCGRFVVDVNVKRVTYFTRCEVPGTDKIEFREGACGSGYQAVKQLGVVCGGPQPAGWVAMARQPAGNAGGIYSALGPAACLGGLTMPLATSAGPCFGPP